MHLWTSYISETAFAYLGITSCLFVGHLIFVTSLLYVCRIVVVELAATQTGGDIPSEELMEIQSAVEEG